MARLPRIVIPNQPLHIMHRGNNRQAIFRTEDDLLRIKEDIAYALSKTGCALHAYVIMTNHLHLLVTPKDKQQLAKFMQAMANRYVRYYNATYKQTGTIWEGRFKSCLVDSEHYLFSLYKYIELNPVKAAMVDNVADYKWSSYRHNALGEIDELIKEPEMYMKLGRDKKQRYQAYRALFEQLDIRQQQNQITKATLKGEVYGSNVFHAKIAQLLDRVTKLTSHGGDRKSEEYRGKV
ncbi:MAG: hypothetical protein GQ582_13440 [Methyloprofundus sp.]|nr:hypothetical protein [Methyloprofundus sp.]